MYMLPWRPRLPWCCVRTCNWQCVPFSRGRFVPQQQTCRHHHNAGSIQHNIYVCGVTTYIYASSASWPRKVGSLSANWSCWWCGSWHVNNMPTMLGLASAAIDECVPVCSSKTDASGHNAGSNAKCLRGHNIYMRVPQVCVVFRVHTCMYGHSIDWQSPLVAWCTDCMLHDVRTYGM